LSVATADELGAAFEDSGFAVIVGHGVAENLIDDMYRVSLDFFALSEAEKMAVVWPAPDILRGYQPVGRGRRYPSGDGPPADLVESFMINRVRPVKDTVADARQVRQWRASNIWPVRPVRLRPVWEAYYREMESLVDRLMALVAAALGVEETWFVDKIDRHFSNLVANYFPAQLTPPEPGQLRTSAHTDHGGLTLLYRDDSPGGLQVYSQGRWIDVPWLPYSFVVNTGDVMSRWTNGRWKATPHRVVNPPADMAAASARQSIAFFHQPNPDLLVTPVPSCEGRALFEPLRCGDHIMAKELRFDRVGAD
jgi:isopenicillin N synthase-like dioxygenase